MRHRCNRQTDQSVELHSRGEMHHGLIQKILSLENANFS